MILVTGATGFVGQCVCGRLRDQGQQVRAVVRNDSAEARSLLPDIPLFPLGDLTLSPDWRPALAGVDTVIHLAARTHVLRDRAGDPEAAYRRLNVLVTEQLLEAAGGAAVTRVIYLSSIKVNGERTVGGAFTGADEPAPEDAYGRTKHAAERLVRGWGEGGGRSGIILRPPMVYGAGARGNLLRLLRWIDRGVPLPFGAVQNRRSLIGVGNLADAVIAAIAPGASSGTYTVADATPVSTPALVRALASQLGRSPRLFAAPPSLLRLGGRLTGKQDVMGRLVDSLEVDSSAARTALGWHPAEPMERGLAAMVQSYRAIPRWPR